MVPIFGLAPETVLLIAAGLLAGLWWLSRSPKIRHDGSVPMTIFCMRCNWEGRVERAAPKCMACGSRSVSVRSV